MDREIPEERKRRLDSLYEAMAIAAEGTYVYLCDIEYDYSRWSADAVTAFALPSEYMYNAGGIWEEHIHPDDRQSFHRSAEEIFSGKASSHDMQYRAKRASGIYEVCTCKGIVIRDKDGNPEYFGGVIRDNDIQEHVDHLTGLRNQYGFFDDLKNYIEKKIEVRVCKFGIEKFAEINEVYGYHFGNRILQQFSRYLFDYVGNGGSLYRLDGTKFAIISTTMEVREFMEKYNTARAHFRKGFFVEQKLIILEVSAAVLSVDNFDVDEETAFACLNFAYNMSKVRRQGDMVEFVNNLTNENRQRIEKLNEIRASIMQDYKGFFLVYQPVVDAHEEKLIGAESLLRWRNEEYGTVPPDHFIPLLERDPLFPDLGQWILKTSLVAAKKIMETFPDFVININLAYTQLEKPSFVNMVLRTLSEVNFPPNHLCLEITERCRLLDMDLLRSIIMHLRGRGVRVALDDFGTGFSSIGLVKYLPLDTIKIDRSFVLKVEEDDKERELVEHFTNVAATFGAKVCVEGIETAGMRDILQKYNISSFQGYYYARPLELDDFLAWSKNMKR